MLRWLLDDEDEDDDDDDDDDAAIAYFPLFLWRCRVRDCSDTGVVNCSC